MVMVNLPTAGVDYHVPFGGRKAPRSARGNKDATQPSSIRASRLPIPSQADVPGRIDWRALALGLAFATIWSSAFTSSRIVVEYWPPFLVLSVRFLLSGMLALGIGFAAGQRIRLTPFGVAGGRGLRHLPECALPRALPLLRCKLSRRGSPQSSQAPCRSASRPLAGSSLASGYRGWRLPVSSWVSRASLSS